ncbi:MAG: glycosyl transferase family 1, partial [Cyanobacteria bacterium J06607_10]
MAHFGLICPALTGHLNTMLPLGKELQLRGHLVTLIGKLDAESKTIAAGLSFKSIGESEFPLGTEKAALAQLGRLSDRDALQYTVNLLKKSAEMLLRETPAAIKALGVEALLV